MLWNATDFSWLNFLYEGLSMHRVLRKDINSGQINESVLRERIGT